MGYRLPFFPMYAAETLADGRFQGWELDERGAWLTLLCYCWNDGSIPSAHSALARLLRVEAGDMARLWSAIGDRFTPVPGDPSRLLCPRLEEERDHAESLGRIRSEAGEKGAKARWNKKNPGNSKRMRLPSTPHSDSDGPAVANGCPGPSPSPPTTTTPPARARLVSPFGSQDPHPQTSAVLAALFDRGIDAAPPGPKSASRVEAAIVAVGIPTATERLASVLPESTDKPLTYHVEAIRGTTKPKATHGDLGAELRPWPDKLTADEKRQARAEFAAIDPNLADAPLQSTGVAGIHDIEAIAAFHEKWRAIVGDRS